MSFYTKLISTSRKFHLHRFNIILYSLICFDISISKYLNQSKKNTSNFSTQRYVGHCFVVVRSCGQTYDNSKCEQKDRDKVGTGSASVQNWYCSCEGDKCNGSTQLAVSFSVLLAAAARFLF